MLEDLLHWLGLVAQRLQMLNGIENQRERLLATLRHERDNLLKSVGLPSGAEVGKSLQS